MADVFVSYSRRDSEFVRRLTDSIEGQGKKVWVDTEGIADAEVFPDAIKRAIEQSDAFLFVITPSSVDSRYCGNEVEYAKEMQKRIVPVLRVPVPDERLHEEIRDRNWIPFTEDAEFDPSMGRLVRALDTDLEAARSHTRWLVKALEWDGESRDRSFLLRGAELKSAEGWLAASPEGADPAPTQLQREYLLASREAAARRQRMLVGASAAVAVVSIGLLIFALISRGQAVSEQVSARSQALSAESQAELPNDPEISLILGMRAVREKATPQSMFALRAALDASPLQLALPSLSSSLPSCSQNNFLSAVYSPNGRQIAEAACNQSLRLIDARSGRVVRTVDFPVGLSAVAYSPDGSVLAVGTNTGATLLDPATGVTRAQLTVADQSPTPVTAAFAFSPNSRLLAADSPAGVTLWSLPSMRERALVRDSNEGGTMSFGRNGRLLIVGGTNDAVHVYDVATGRMVHSIVATGNQGNGWPEVVALSPDGSRLAVGYPTLQGMNGTVSIYNTSSWTKLFDVTTVDDVEISSLAFSPDGTRLAIGAEDGTAGVWSLQTREQVASYDGSTAAVGSMSIAPDGHSVLSASNDGVSRVWRAQGVEQTSVFRQGYIAQVILDPHRLIILGTLAEGRSALFSYSLPGGKLVSTWTLPRALQAPTLSSDGRLMATLPGGSPSAPPSTNSGPPQGPLRVWSVATHKLVAMVHPTQAANVVGFSQDDRFIGLLEGGSSDTAGTPTLVNIATGHTVTSRASNVPCLSADSSDYVLSRNDRVIAIAGFCGEVELLSAVTGKVMRTLNQGAEISAVDLSPDGSRLLVASWDSRATIYDVVTGRPLINLIGHTRGIAWGGFAAGGSLAVTVSLDHTVRVWNAGTGQQLRVLTFSGLQGNLVLSPNGQEMAITENTPQLGPSGVVRVFSTCPACQNAKALLAQARPHAAPSSRLTVLERTVVNGS